MLLKAKKVNILKESRDALKEAHDVLKVIVKKIKEADPKQIYHMSNHERLHQA